MGKSSISHIILLNYDLLLLWPDKWNVSRQNKSHWMSQSKAIVYIAKCAEIEEPPILITKWNKYEFQIWYFNVIV